MRFSKEAGITRILTEFFQLVRLLSQDSTNQHDDDNKRVRPPKNVMRHVDMLIIQSVVFDHYSSQKRTRVF